VVRAHVFFFFLWLQAAALSVVNQAVSCDRLIKELRKRGLKSDDGGEGRDGDKFDWASLGRAVGPFFATLPPVEFLCGPIRLISFSRFRHRVTCCRRFQCRRVQCRFLASRGLSYLLVFFVPAAYFFEKTSKPAVVRKERLKRKAEDDEEEEEEDARNERPENVTTKDDDLVESTQARLKVGSDKKKSCIKPLKTPRLSETSLLHTSYSSFLFHLHCLHSFSFKVLGEKLPFATGSAGATLSSSSSSPNSAGAVDFFSFLVNPKSFTQTVRASFFFFLQPGTTHHHHHHHHH
jgi:hypothetical protein